MSCVRFAMMVLACLTAVDASAAQPDKRVAKALKKAGIEYSVDADGDYEILVSVGRRTHKVWVRSETSWFDAAEVRDIFAYAHVTPEGEGLPDDLYRSLLERHYKIGAWITEAGRAASFSAAIDARAKPHVLRSAILAVAESADDLEKELTGNEDAL